MGIEESLPSGVLLTSVERFVGWVRKSSMWPASFGLACCAFELMATGAPLTTLRDSAWRSLARHPGTPI